VSNSTAGNRADHYLLLIRLADTSRGKVNAACDYVRAALAQAPPDRVDRAVAELVAIAKGEASL
jgi:hypothetical protein